MGRVFIYKFTDIKFTICPEGCILPLRNYGMDFRFSGNDGNMMTCADAFEMTCS